MKQKYYQLIKPFFKRSAKINRLSESLPFPPIFFDTERERERLQGGTTQTQHPYILREGKGMKMTLDFVLNYGKY